MSCKAEYTPQEWRDLITLAFYVMGEKAGEIKKSFFFTRIIGLIKESLAFQASMKKASGKYPTNGLIGSLVSSMSAGPGEKRDCDVPEELPHLEELVYRVNQILDEKSDETEAREYRAFVYELAYDVCKSAGAGFLGTGENIDAHEAEFLQRLKTALLGEE
ncbi:MAG: hypothetical protein ACOYXC_12335 [Candidatus Rifleibacteriota bacterium]